MNYSLVAADRMTHVKIVVVALIGGISVIAGGIYALPTGPDLIVGHVSVDPSTIKASKSAIVGGTTDMTGGLSSARVELYSAFRIRGILCRSGSNSSLRNPDGFSGSGYRFLC